ncbi:MAG: glycosyltransferase family 2 protein [Pseudomonadota bacterium]
MPVTSVCFVIPTYNEADNITSLLNQLLALLDERSQLRGQILVVDDQSPDGTADRVEEISRGDDRVSLLSGPKEGLGTAYSRGFNHVLANFDVDAVVQMDADFSHKPGDVVHLLEGLEDADVVIGSRYVEHGEIDEIWGWRRKMLSKMGNLFARYVAGLYNIKDCTAGFKAIRLSALTQAFPLRQNIQGYVFQVALLHSLAMAGVKIIEHPIRFHERQAGVTKLGGRDIWEFFLHVWWLRLLSRKTFIKFGLVGVSGVVVNLGGFWLLSSMGLGDYLSSAIAIEVSIIWNFFWNNYWTFSDRTISSRKRVRGLKFNAVSIITLLVSFVSFVFLRWWLPEFPAILAQAVSIVPAALANYFANSYWTFKSDSGVS